MSVIVDASVAVKWVAEEPASDRARALFLSDECWAPGLIIAEIGNALWKKRRLKLVTLKQAVAALEELPSRLRLFDIANLAARAMQIAVELNLPSTTAFILRWPNASAAPS